ncbi:FAD-dependent monooxygenase [Antrihabitans sp. YC2-6]|uniref:FAD-dependent monooxygenase n=1 Tax=Antrihabitans sp. YC2-6 TaxID=2799498 RepID=UPI0018F5D096|nr:FAD-dependent monooxygenase [Antrihabitans sp. YC2-6]MBJ8348885.1 FAD-dependent monooxygenase [Antrihabitans sp. YC2-6]
MRLADVAVIGGGPGGLYAARLLKLRHPDADVVVYEQGFPDKTFGFGVGLASRTQRNLRTADAASLDAIVDVAYSHEMSMQVGDSVARLPQRNLLAIARTRLLAVLQEQAEAAGVRLEFGDRREISSIAADLIVAADGVGSPTRNELADQLDVTVDTGSGLYLWCGTEFALPSAIFVPITTAHGTFVAHGYPYEPDRSTFLIETDETTWRNAGFDRTTEQTAHTDSDEVALRYLEQAFEGPLAGHALVGNKTRWTRFRTVKCGSWHRGNVVLLGDAAHTAHYSIGSGTKLAMEDAIALDAAIAESPDLATALVAYETQRRPAVAHLQEVAHRSELWWESFAERLDLPVEQLLLAYMTRAGKVDLDRYANSAPAVARAGLAAYAGVAPAAVPDAGITSWVLGRPLEVSHDRYRTRTAEEALRTAPSTALVSVDFDSAWSIDADALVDNPPRAETLWLTGCAERSAVLTRLDVAERLRRRTGSVVVVEAPRRYSADLAAGLASGRTDLVAFTDELDSAAATPAELTEEVTV